MICRLSAKDERIRADPLATDAGNLALSRALGDFEFKQSTTLDPEHQIVTADPDITLHEHTAEDEFLVIACDGKSSLCPRRSWTMKSSSSVRAQESGMSSPLNK